MAYFLDYFAYNGVTGFDERMTIPEWTVGAGFADHSYRNDAMARMTLKSNPWVTLWVAEELAKDREWPEEGRYLLQIWPETDEGAVEDPTDFLRTDDPEAILAFLADPSDAFLEKAAGGLVEAAKDEARRAAAYGGIR